MSDELERLAIALRHAAFPGAGSWDVAAHSTKEQWRRAAAHADSYMRRHRDAALRKASTRAIGLGQGLAANMMADMRRSFDREMDDTL